jgi:ATP synthase protein I
VSILVQKVKKSLYQVVFWQLVVIIGLALILWLLQGFRVGLSAFLGGLAYWLPTLFFMWRVSNHAGARAAGRFMIAFFTGEAMKLFLSGVLFVVTVKYFSVIPVYVLIGFVGAIVAFWIVSITLVYRQEGQT